MTFRFICYSNLPLIPYLRSWRRIKALKMRIWLIEDEKMHEMSPKEYYKGAFRDIVQEIKQNEKSIRIIIKCPICNAKNLSFNKFCYKCRKKLSL